MKDIAAAVHLTAASLYHHFPSKDALLLAVLEAGMAESLARVQPIVEQPGMTSAEKLRALICEHISGITQNTAIGAAMVFEIRTLMIARPPSERADDAERAAYDEFVARRNAFFRERDLFEECFRRVLREGIARGEFRAVDAAIFTKTMLGAQNWVGVWFRPDGRLNGGQIAAMMADTFLAAVVQAG